MSSQSAEDFPSAPASVHDYRVTPYKNGLKFWIMFTSMCTCVFLASLGVSSLSTALPTISWALDTSQFTWFGSAYSLASTAFVPMNSGLARAFGRRPATVIAISLFVAGSGICGCAMSMSMLIMGRIIQGFGGGGIQSLTGIILADIVSLQECGIYAGLYGLTWSLAASVGPVVGGSLAIHGQWRWMFLLNLPISLVACVLVIFLLDLPVPTGSYREKLRRMDWIGNFLIIASTIAYTIGLTWGGVTAPWGSLAVLVPLVVGFVGLGIFIAYEATLAKYPLVPFSILTNLTSVSGYIQTFCSTIITLGIVYYFPVYFQACKGASPVSSGVYLLSFASLVPTIIITGISIKTTGQYRIQTWLGWILTIISLSFLSVTLTADSLERSLGCLVLLGSGVGILNATAMYPIQAPLPVTQNAPAISFMWFTRSFGSVWGIAIGSAVLRNELVTKLPEPYIRSAPHGIAVVYALIPDMSKLDPQTRSEVQVAFASSLVVLWRVLLAISLAGFLVSLFMKGFPLPNALDGEWTLKNKKDQSVCERNA